MRHQLLIVGNVLLTGPYGFRFKSDLDASYKSRVIETASKELINHYNKTADLKIRSSLMKDFYINETPSIVGYNEFRVQPSMYLNLKDEWKSIEDYLSSIKSKYKVRYKRSRKKFAKLETHLMTHEELVQWNDRMYELFSATAKKADFNLFELHPKYFVAIHEVLGNDMLSYGIFENDKLIAFYTLIKNDHVAEAHFLGYDLVKNRDYQLYQNMLYNILETSIEKNVTELNLSRTALEIKSSAGAQPKDLNLLAKAENPLINKLLPFFLRIIVPKKEWVERNPFKDN